MESVYVKPAPGARVRQPNRGSRVMPAVGDNVPRDSYYEPMIASGDLVVSEPPAVSTPSEPPAAPRPDKQSSARSRV